MSHKESIIVLLPKEGKDIKDIKNWRPITLSNCDAKIITKDLAIRMSNVMNEIIVNTQTAYVRGRSVIDNLRSIAFMNDHCRNENVESVMVSLDAKKGFDSVDHGYVVNTLSRYGFGPRLIMFFKTFYKNASAKILINGHLSERIGIHRGFKQGDAFSNG